MAASVLFASIAAALGSGSAANAYYPGPNVTYTYEVPDKLLITVSRPTRKDADGQWADFVRAVFQRNVSLTAWPGGRPVLTGRSELGVGLRAPEHSISRDWIADRRLLPGDILALGGPNSHVTAAVMIDRFRRDKPYP